MPAKRKKFELDVAPDVQRRIEEIAATLEEFAHVDASRVVCFRSQNSTARIYARIWGLDRIWQMALGVEAHYAVEVVEYFDRSSEAEQDRTLIHELMHIPKTFSGALVPHTCFGKKINCDSVEVLYARLLRVRLERERAAATPPPVPPLPPRASAALAVPAAGLAEGATSSVAARDRHERSIESFTG